MTMISIIIPVYNSEDYLQGTLKSILNQTVKDFEVILVDDGSNDSSPQICKNFVEKYGNFTYVKNKKKGVSSARNYGVQLAKGEIIAFVDSDDLVENIMIENLLKAINKSDFAVGSYIRFDGCTSKKIRTEPFYGETKDFFQNIEGYIDSLTLQSPWCKAFRKRIIIDNKIKFPENMNFGEDAYFVYEYLKYAKTICAFDEIIYSYRVTNNGLCHSFKRYKYDVNLLLNKKIYDLYVFYTGKYNKSWLIKMNQQTFVSFANDCVAAKNRHIGYQAMRLAIQNRLTHWSFNQTEFYVPFGSWLCVTINKRWYAILFILFELNKLKNKIKS